MKRRNIQTNTALQYIIFLTIPAIKRNIFENVVLWYMHIVSGFQRHPGSKMTSSRPAMSAQRIVGQPRLNEI